MSLGIILIGIGVIMVIAAGILFIRYQRNDKALKVSDFDEKFERETSINPSRIELAYKRKQMADDLGVKNVKRKEAEDFSFTPNIYSDIRDKEITDNKEDLYKTEKLI